jgi:hypothetical protein
VTDAAFLAGLIPAGAPEILHITQPANGTLIVESQINEGHSRMYKPGGKFSSPAGQGGSITVSSKWDGKTLVSEGTREAPSGTSASVKETFALGEDGTLTINVTSTEGSTTHASTLVYAKTTTVGACETWPTPCKIK